MPGKAWLAWLQEKSPLPPPLIIYQLNNAILASRDEQEAWPGTDLSKGRNWVRLEQHIIAAHAGHGGKHCAADIPHFGS